MKTIDLLCASPASTAICSSMDQRAMVRRGHHSTRSINDRRNHYISDSRRKFKNNVPMIPCSSQLPVNPTSYHQKSRKSTSDCSSTSASVSRRTDQEVGSKNSTEINDLAITPHGSSRHLLSDKPFNELLPETDQLSSSLMVPSEAVLPRSLSSNDSALVSTDQALRPRRQLTSNDPLLLKSANNQLVVSQSMRKPPRLSSNSESSVLKSSSARSRSRYQVVELMVSIHCKGCEGKVRKHISRMEGVTSFSIDRETKKVIVIGEVTPLGVLSSISKVKNAQFWPSLPSSSS